MDNDLNNILKEYFSQREIFNVAEISCFYSGQNPNISQTTINWRIHKLVQSGVIQRVGRGVYRLGKSNPFQMDLSPQIKKIAQTIKKEFPYTNFCVWELAMINLFSHNLINFNLFFIDVERDAIDAVYYKLKERQKNVVNIRKTYDDISDLAGNVCIRPLVSHAPTQIQSQISVASLEKILVDLATDKEFFPFQGNEIFTIYENAFEKYTINENSMLRYAARKNKRENIKTIINTILGDKLTAFAPNTTGIPYRKSDKEMGMEIIKQMYDIGCLYDKADNPETISAVFSVFAKTELAYRENKSTIENVLNDIIETALSICLRQSQGKSDFSILHRGVIQVKPFIFSEQFHLEKAITYAAKVAYIATVIKLGVKHFSRFNKDLDMKDWIIAKPMNTKLNKIKKTNPEAFFYLYQMFEIVKNNREKG